MPNCGTVRAGKCLCALLSELLRLTGLTAFFFASPIYLGVSPAWSADLEKTVAFNIPAQPLESALLVFGKQARTPVVISSDVSANTTAPAVNGAFPVGTALAALLRQSGLQFKEISGTITVMRANDLGSETQHAPPTRVGSGPHESNPTTDVRSEPESLTEVIVTAQKRQERLIDTPLSITALTSNDIDKLGAVQFRDFANTVPGLSYTTVGAGYTAISLRGVTTGNDISPTVGVYVDDVPYGSSSSFAMGAQLALDVGLFDVDRIEVLRGPQGTLYGASTMGGLIKYVSKQPDTNNVGVDVQSGVSSTKDGGVNFNVASAVNLPLLADKAAVRLSGFESRDGGYIDNVNPALSARNINHSDVYGGRVELLFTPTDSLSIRINGFLQDISRDGEATANYSSAGTPLYGSLDQYRLFAEPFDQHFRLVSGTVGYDLGLAQLTSISSYQRTAVKLVADFSGLYVPEFAPFGFPYSAYGVPRQWTTDKFTQELRLASKGDTPLEWLIGGFYTHETSTNIQSFELLDLAGQPTPNNLFNVSAPSVYKEYAGFADLTYHFTSEFDISGGVRYARNEQTYTQFGSGFVGNEPPSSSSEGVFTYLTNARYHLSEHATAYVRYATGYRPGGPNFVATNPTTGFPVGSTTFQADRLKSYEVGYKAESADQAFGIDLAAYYINWRNMQIAAIRGGLGVIANAPGATIRGAELTVTTRPIPGLTGTAAFTYQNAKMSEADADLGAANGERLPNVPRFTTALTADYLFSNSLRPTVGASVRYVSDRTASFDQSVGFPQYNLPAYAAVDLRSGFVLNAASAHSVAFQLYVHNLLDRRGQLADYNNFGPGRVAILQPRTIGISASTHF
jgi:iron complex outermembrane recepter protein